MAKSDEKFSGLTGSFSFFSCSSTEKVSFLELLSKFMDYANALLISGR